MKILVKLLLLLIFSCVSINTKSRNLFIITENSKVGLLDSRGTWVVKPQFEYIYESSISGKNYAIVGLNGKYGVISEKGKVLIKVKFKELIPWNNKYIFALSSKNNKWGIINLKGGTWILEAKYDKISRNDAYDKDSIIFSAFFKGEWGLYNLTGDRVINYKSKKKPIYHFSNDRFLVLNDKTNFLGIIDDKGEWISKLFKKDKLSFSTINKIITIKSNKGWGIMNINGEWLFKPQFSQIIANIYGPLHFKNLWVQKKKVWSAINILTGKFIINKFILNENRIPVYISKKFLASHKFKKNKDGSIDINMGSSLKIYNLTGKEQFKNYQFLAIEKDYLFFKNKQNKSKGILDSNGKIIFESSDMEYGNILYFINDNVIFVKLNNKIGCIDYKGNWLIKPIYDYINTL